MHRLSLVIVCALALAPGLTHAQTPEPTAEAEAEAEPAEPEPEPGTPAEAEAEPGTPAEPGDPGAPGLEGEPAEHGATAPPTEAGTPDAAAVEAPAPDPTAYAAALRSHLTILKEMVKEKLVDKMMAKQDGQMAMVSGLLGGVAFAGFLMLGLPLVVRSRFPGKTALLVKQSALGALLFFVTVNLLTGALVLLRNAQAALGSLTNPQITMLDGVFATLDKEAGDLSGLSSVLDPTLQQLATSEEPFVALLMTNLGKIRADITVFQSIASMLKSLDWLFGALPFVTAILAVVLFVISFKPLLLDIVRMPIRAAEGTSANAWAFAKETLRRVGREFLSVLSLILVLFVVTLVSAGILSQLLQPAMEALLAFAVAGFFYVQVEANISSSLMLLSLSAVALFLVLSVGVVLAGNIFFLSKAQKIFHQRFVDRVPLGTHRAFWGRGSLALLWSQLLPLGFIMMGTYTVEKVFEKYMATEPPSFLSGMLISGVLLVVGFLTFYWLTRGFRALRYIARYKV